MTEAVSIELEITVIFRICTCLGLKTSPYLTHSLSPTHCLSHLCLITHSPLTHLLAHLFTHCFSHSLNHVHPPTHSLPHSPTNPPSHSLPLSLTDITTTCLLYLCCLTVTSCLNHHDDYRAWDYTFQ